METKTNFLKVSLLALFLFITSTAFAANNYVCIGGTFTIPAITPALPGTTTYSWDIKKIVGGVHTSIGGIYPTTASTTYAPPTVIPAGAGAGEYEIVLIFGSTDAAVCAPNAAQLSNIYVLPALSLTLAAPTNPAYCGSAAINSSVITATPAGFPAGANYSTDLVLEYSFTATKDGNAVADLSTVGTFDTATGVFTVNTTVAGEYIVSTAVKYKLNGAGGAFLGGSNGCPSTPVASTKVTVSSTPATPIISIG